MYRALICCLLASACGYALESPKPQAEEIAPQLVCAEQLVTTVTVSGENLTPLPTDVLNEPTLQLPDVEVTRTGEPDGTATTGDPLPVDTVHWIDAETLTFDVTPELALTPGIHDIEVRNPDGQETHLAQAFQAVPAPILEGADPEVLCAAQGARQVTLTGAGFLEVGHALPVVTVGAHDLTADGVDDCFDLGGPVEARSCTTLTVTIPQGALDEGVHDLIVTNPSTAGCSSTETVQIEVTAPPVLAAIEEALVCGEQLENTFTLTGEGFLRIGADLPTVSIGAYEATADALGGTCTDLEVADGERCTELTLTTPADVLPTGLQDVAVTNPDPAGCTSGDPVTAEVLAAPTVSHVVPDAVCSEATQAFTLAVHGAGFLFTETTAPEVQIGAFDDYVPLPVLESCTPLQGDVEGDLCDTLEVDVPDGRYTDVGEELVTVTNPAPAACDSVETPADLLVQGPPEITGVAPLRMCGGGHEVAITGEGFTTATTVTAVSTQGAEVDLTVLSLSETEGIQTLVATFPGDTSPGFYGLEVENADGCGDTWGEGLPEACELPDCEPYVEITHEPLVFFVDPPVHYQPVSLQAKVYVSGVNLDDDEGVVDVRLTDPSGVTASVDDAGWSWDVDEPSRVFLTLEAGLDVGDWGVTIEDAVGCTASLEEAFTVTDEAAVVIEEVTPAFAWTGDFTPIEVRSLPDDDLDDTATPAERNFQDVPRLYLDPVDGGDGTVATEVYAVTWSRPDLLDAIVPAGLAPGAYDLLVINPDQSVGLAPAALEVTAASPPVVDAVSPTSVTNEASADLELFGDHFRDDVTVTLECVHPATGQPYPDQDATFGAISDGGQTLAVTFDASAYTRAVCILLVTNTDNDTFERFAAISVTNPAAKLTEFQDGGTLQEPRRAPVATVGRATRTSRYLYAIGGEDGDTLHDTLEWARVGSLGDLGSFFLPDESDYVTPVHLPAPRTLAGVARIGRHIYLVGGEDDQGLVDDVLRAQVLDPLAAPRVLDIRVDTSDPGPGLGAGTWIYRVAALYDTDDVDNPGGESLPSDPFVVRLPDTPTGLDVELTWSEPASGDIVGYRIYRTPAAGTGSGTEEWVHDVTGADTRSWVDEGVDALGGKPLPPGALGRWLSIPLPSDDVDPNLGDPVPRAFPCVSWGQDPVAPGLAHLYVGGGLAGDGVRDDIHALAIDVGGEHHQDVIGWTRLTDGLEGARWQCSGHRATRRTHEYVEEGDTWVYFGPGASNEAGTTIVDDTTAGLVGPGGVFTDYVSLGNDLEARAGYAWISASNRLYVYAGTSGGSPLASGWNHYLCGNTDPLWRCSNVTNEPPQVAPATGEPEDLGTGRALPGSAQEAAVFFIVGGETGTEAATATVEWNNY